MRAFCAVLFPVMSGTAWGQSLSVEQTHSLDRTPGVRVRIVDRAVLHGAKESEAKLDYAAPGVHRRYTDWQGHRLTDMFFPQAGVYKKTTARLKGSMFDLTETFFNSPKLEDHTLFNGSKNYRVRREPDPNDPRELQFQVHVDAVGLSPSQLPLLGVFQLEKLGDFDFSTTEIDPTFGALRVYEASHGRTAAVAVDRDWMLVRLSGKQWSLKVLEMAQIDGHWMPTKILREGEGRKNDLDVYRTLSYDPAPQLTVSDFTPRYEKNMTWMEDGVMYDVVKGKLVKSPIQPSADTDRRMKLVGFAVLAVTTAVLGLIGSNIFKLFGKSHGPVGGERES